jgi:hypothetical protein
VLHQPVIQERLGNDVASCSHEERSCTHILKISVAAQGMRVKRIAVGEECAIAVTCVVASDTGMWEAAELRRASGALVENNKVTEGNAQMHRWKLCECQSACDLLRGVRGAAVGGGEEAAGQLGEEHQQARPGEEARTGEEARRPQLGEEHQGCRERRCQSQPAPQVAPT